MLDSLEDDEILEINRYLDFPMGINTKLLFVSHSKKEYKAGNRSTYANAFNKQETRVRRKRARKSYYSNIQE